MSLNHAHDAMKRCLFLFLLLFAPLALQAQNTLPTSSPTAEGLNPTAVATFLERAKATHTDALVILKNGNVVAEQYNTEQRPIEAMSVTKSIVNLAIGHLLDTGRLDSLNQPVHTLYPEWRQGRKEQITIRHLLNHTSGLHAHRTTQKIYASPDFVQFALAADIQDDPGSNFFYNNKAVNLLAGVVEQASGQTLDAYLGEHIFAPLGITDFTWTTDVAGNPHAMSGLQIHALDLAKIGQMMLQDGMWNGQQILSASWIETSLEQAQPFVETGGLLWWRSFAYTKYALTPDIVAGWKAAGVAETYLDQAEAYYGQTFDRPGIMRTLQTLFGAELQTIRTQLTSANTPPFATKRGPVVGFNANGYLGQYLVVYPEHQLVVARQITHQSHTSDADGFGDFFSLVQTLVEE